tara:strand:- start:73 stop:519 length:447 start_codon:yes stop_codon:yes gene_type:complete
MQEILNVIKNQVLNLLICKKKSDKQQFNIIKSSLVVLLRKWCDNKPIVFISISALEEAKKYNIDLSKMKWKDQTKFDPKREVFHYEHKYPISDMINDMMDSPETIEDVLDKYEVGWILKEEDKRLKSYNRNNHDKEYLDNGITIKKIN